jgi:hypothetical protein
MDRVFSHSPRYEIIAASLGFLQVWAQHVGEIPLSMLARSTPVGSDELLSLGMLLNNMPQNSTTT